jgi:hypothetical protein
MLHSEKRSEPLKRIDLYMDKVLWDRVKELGAQRDLSASEVVRRLISAELKKVARAPKTPAKSIEVPF